jgi:uncharacterized protein YjbJ (UPF0337 family)
MTKIVDKIEGRTKEVIGEIIGDGRLASEGGEQVRNAGLKPRSEDHRIADDRDIAGGSKAER